MWPPHLQTTRCLIASAFCIAAFTSAPLAQKPPPIGIAPVAVGARPYLFDTAEQHRLRVVVVARGLSHPYGLAFLPNGDALLTERGTRLRIVRNVTGQQSGQGPTLDPTPVGGLPVPPTIEGGGF